MAVCDRIPSSKEKSQYQRSHIRIYYSFGDSIREGDNQSKFLEETSSDRHPCTTIFFAIGLMGNS
ncbi:MAG: hypothetical protein RMY64_34075 [Nostoc sp. DedQUE08]|uniref:hypothetical protein n=1 Tax=Nostoc sp. DedQUE08 TaxID=3075393 RepID=UPI002AD5A591|nr:hypothetical protein [Nostoc sp. DedQUE08]MDZ8070582.1 hypothetical protein [Nostoc sp. DedQUE08]